MGETVHLALKDDYFYLESAEEKSGLGRLSAERVSPPS